MVAKNSLFIPYPHSKETTIAVVCPNLQSGLANSFAFAAMWWYNERKHIYLPFLISWLARKHCVYLFLQVQQHYEAQTFLLHLNNHEKRKDLAFRMPTIAKNT